MLLFGQLLEKLWLLFISTSGHTAWDRNPNSMLKIWSLYSPKPRSTRSTYLPTYQPIAVIRLAIWSIFVLVCSIYPAHPEGGPTFASPMCTRTGRLVLLSKIWKRWRFYFRYIWAFLLDNGFLFSTYFPLFYLRTYQRDQKKIAKCLKSCPKMISIEKW